MMYLNKIKTVVFAWMVFLHSTNVASSCPSECRCFGFSGDWIADCSTQNLTQIPSGFAENTTEIFLQNNLISTLPENAFSGLTKLKFLYLHNNNISEIAPAVFADPSLTLKYLTLHDNQIRILPGDVFAGMSDLIVLNLNNNLLNSLPPSLVRNLTGLVQISFSGNNLSSIDDVTFDDLSKLKYIGLSNNKLRSLPQNWGNIAPDLYSIDYSGNNLETLPPVPSTANQIYATGNSISTLSSSSFANATELYEMFLSLNRISAIENDTFLGATSLGWLDLSGNAMERVDDFTFDHLSKLQGLYLAYNEPLSSVSSHAFEGFNETIYRLSFDSCNFTWIDADIIASLTNKQLVIWMGNNPWNCDCNLQDVVELVQSSPSKFYDLNQITCQNPDDVKGKKMTTVDSKSRCSPAPITKAYSELGLAIGLSIAAAVVFVVIVGFLINARTAKIINRNRQQTERTSRQDEVASVL
ncbi:uncharacterized protein LOC143469459 [Clavelina lepadiformis]|uniref:uncharacterized protein LOC143469459 n=1 Tax=Clavelina lepadiformis TaxID=159417 RepID=UPI004041AB87